MREIGGLRVRRGLQHEREPQELDDIARERQEILAVARGPVDRLERRTRVMPDNGRRERAHRNGRRRAEQLRGRVRLEPAFTVGDRRVEERERVAQRAFGRAHDDRQCRRLERNLFLVQDALERRAQRIGRDRAEIEALHAREHGRRNLARVRRREHEDDVGRWLFQGLQECVEGRSMM